MRILLIGASGQLGSDLIRNDPGHDIVAPDRKELDVTQGDAIVVAIRDTRPDWVVNTAAFHNVPVCEEQPERAFRVNCIAVRDLALACEKHGARLMTFSTDYVFNGEQRKPYREEARTWREPWRRNVLLSFERVAFMAGLERHPRAAISLISELKMVAG
jgi:dTDP-4-dehydrorhamnose reductase